MASWWLLKPHHDLKTKKIFVKLEHEWNPQKIGGERKKSFKPTADGFLYLGNPGIHGDWYIDLSWIPEQKSPNWRKTNHTYTWIHHGYILRRDKFQAGGQRLNWNVDCKTRKLEICTYRCFPRTQLASIFEGQPPKIRPKLQSKQGSFWVLGLASNKEMKDINISVQLFVSASDLVEQIS